MNDINDSTIELVQELFATYEALNLDWESSTHTFSWVTDAFVLASLDGDSQ